MRRFLTAAAFLASFAAAMQAQAQVQPTPLPPGLAETVAAVKARALASDLGFEIVRDLVTEVGPRPAGWESEARAREWTAAKMKALGSTNVRIEPFTIAAWRRTAEQFEITAPFKQAIVATALGWSAPTPAGGLEGEVARFANLAALSAAPAGSLAGKIAFIDEKMARTQEGGGYGAAQVKRRQGAQIAASKGAIASIIRTAGTSPDRVANTGSASPAGTLTPIPAAALSNPDSDQLARLVAQGSVRLRLLIQVETKADAPSGNVVGEIRGRDKPNEIVALGAHLDSWDTTLGAQDDATGVAMAIAAAKFVADQKQRPRRTIRVILFGAEETGLLGGQAYVKAHQDEMALHITGAESDTGGGAVYRLRTKFGDSAKAAALHGVLADMAIITDATPARGASEMGLLGDAGVPVIDLNVDAYRYFDIHHTIADTLEKIDRDAYRQQVAAFAAFAAFAADSGWDFRAKP